MFDIGQIGHRKHTAHGGFTCRADASVLERFREVRGRTCELVKIDGKARFIDRAEIVA